MGVSSIDAMSSQFGFGMWTFCLVLEKTIDLFDGAIEGADGKAMVCYVQDEVLAHDSQADEAKVSTGVHPRGSADVDAGKTSAIVSRLIPINACSTNLERQ